MFGRASIVWFGILLVAIANGAFRQGVLIPRVGDASGHVVSTLMLSLAVVLVTWFTIGWIGPRTRRDAWLVGGCWLTLTVAFEFLAGHYLFGTPWPVLLADYNVLRGRVWPLVLVVTFVAPAIASRDLP